jgi:hypothetical protein
LIEAKAIRLSLSESVMVTITIHAKYVSLVIIGVMNAVDDDQFRLKILIVKWTVVKTVSSQDEMIQPNGVLSESQWSRSVRKKETWKSGGLLFFRNNVGSEKADVFA